LPSALTSTDILDLAVLALLITALAFALWSGPSKGAGAAAVAPFFLLTPLIPPPAL
jgi:probable blue pigment (indigoidine) exporter